MENMKEVLKKTRKSRHKKSRAHKASNESDLNSDAISEILSKNCMNWMFSSPPTQSNSTEDASSPKINAFERMMAKKCEPLTQLSPEINGIKKKRKYTKKAKHNKLDADNEIDSEEPAHDENHEANKTANTMNMKSPVKGKILNGTVASTISDEIEKPLEEPITRKRNRAFDTPTQIVDSASKKRKTKVDKMLLDSNENSIETPVKCMVEPELDTPTNNSGRPRRSCAGKVNYELLISPDKISPDRKPLPRKSKARNKDDDSDFIETVIVDEESPDKHSKPKKLAPMFMKKLPKPTVDPAVKEARRNFLLSGLPEDLRNSIDKQKQFEDEILLNELIAFPTIAHVMQSSADNTATITEDSWSKSRVKISADDDDDECELLQLQRPLSRGMFTDCKADDAVSVTRDEIVAIEHETIKNIKEIVKELKENFVGFSTNRCYKQLHCKRQNAKREEIDADSSSEIDNGINNENSLFIDIFKPTKFDEFILNCNPVKDLQKFLLTWNDKDKSDDDYDSDASNSRQSSKTMNNFAVLSGRSGTGKTSSVYAVASDLNYQVIEINAGSRRSGKKMLQDLLEATQSHRVKNTLDNENSQESSCGDVSSGAKSIILIEDAELAFDSDDGFVSSIQQLINISKRPVVLTTNDRHCQHLQKFIQHNEIVFDGPKHAHHIAKYLSLLCLAANYQINAVAIEHLCALNGHDLRKTINEIEFFIRSDNAGANGGNLMELYRRPRREHWQKGQLNCANKGLSTVRFESSIVSCFAAMADERAESDEISYHQRDLMDEMAEFVSGRRCNMLEIQRDLAHGKQKLIDR